jgi:hypothetical protein
MNERICGVAALEKVPLMQTAEGIYTFSSSCFHSPEEDATSGAIAS